MSGAEEVMVDLARMVRNNIKRTMARPAHSLVIIIVLLTYLGLVTQGSLVTSSGLNINTAEKQKHSRKGKIVAVRKTFCNVVSNDVKISIMIGHIYDG